jgi:hypothetical protein
MAKKRLDLDSIEVESFMTASAGTSGAGTVFGHANTYDAESCNEACGSAIDACSGDSGCGHMYCPPETYLCASVVEDCGPAPIA